MPRRRKSDPFYKEYDPNFHPQDIIELMSTGKFNVHVYTKWDISESTFYRWLREYPELDEAYQRGLPKCEAWWIDNVFNKMVEGKLEGRHSFNAAMAMANAKFKYRIAGAEAGQQTTNNIHIQNMNVLDNKTSEELLDKIKADLEFLNNKNVIDTDYKVLTHDSSELNKQD